MNSFLKHVVDTLLCKYSSCTDRNNLAYLFFPIPFVRPDEMFIKGVVGAKGKSCCCFLLSGEQQQADLS